MVAACRIYVATAFERRADLAIPQMVKLRSAGLTISHDWTRDSFSTDPPRLEEETRFAQNDIRGVENSDAVWLLSPETSGCGCWFELGYACAIGKPVLLSGVHRTIFDTHRLVKRFETHERAGDWLIGVFQDNLKLAALEGGWQGIIYHYLFQDRLPFPEK